MSRRGKIPTVNRLQDMVAELLGKEAAVYLPSGTMCNEISFAVWGRTGDEMILHRDSHPAHFEVGGPAYLARLMLYPVDGPRGLSHRNRSKRRFAPTAHIIRAAASSRSKTPTTWAAARSGPCHNCKPSVPWHITRSDHPPRRGAPVECRSRDRHPGQNLCRALRLRLGRPVQRPWLPCRCGISRLARVYQGCLALEAPVWWGHASSGHHRCCGRLCLEHHVARLAEDHTHAS